MCGNYILAALRFNLGELIKDVQVGNNTVINTTILDITISESKEIISLIICRWRN
ncbi:hypothetical protein Mapa_006931 [Marchantia paleacea]|nr:hypothetical protein Mapa_006931 [Marchantia paleacea]